MICSKCRRPGKIANGIRKGLGEGIALIDRKGVLFCNSCTRTHRRLLKLEQERGRYLGGRSEARDAKRA